MVKGNQFLMMKISAPQVPSDQPAVWEIRVFLSKVQKKDIFHCQKTYSCQLTGYQYAFLVVVDFKSFSTYYFLLLSYYTFVFSQQLLYYSFSRRHFPCALRICRQKYLLCLNTLRKCWLIWAHLLLISSSTQVRKMSTGLLSWKVTTDAAEGCHCQHQFIIYTNCTLLWEEKLALGQGLFLIMIRMLVKSLEMWNWVMCSCFFGCVGPWRRALRFRNIANSQLTFSLMYIIW